MNIDNPRSFGVIYCKSILSISKFLSQYNDIDDFLKFADSFDIDNHHRRLLPLYIQAEITGYGFALACDLIKNYINPNYVKPDVHIKKISRKLGITDAKSKDYQIFKDVIDYCDRQGLTPYAVDRVFWLIGSGRFEGQQKISASVDKFFEYIRIR